MNNPYQKETDSISEIPKSLRSQPLLAQSSNSENLVCRRNTYQTTCYSLDGKAPPQNKLQEGVGGMYGQSPPFSQAHL